MNLIKPKFWDQERLSFLSFVLLPLTLIAHLFNFLRKNKKKVKSKIKTICIGNIYLGGTGKTPLTIKLKQLLSKKYKTVLIKKYYPEHEDEIELLKKYGKLITSKNRLSSVRLAEKNFKLALFDDGLQDPNLIYDFSIVCFNSRVGLGNKLVIPAGPMRESLKNLNKYNTVFINGKKNNQLIKQIKKFNKTIKVFRGEFILKNLRELKQNNNNLIFSGIGNPNDFERLLINNKINITRSFKYPDHYKFSLKEIMNFKKIAKLEKLKLITTEKNYIRLPKKLKKNINFTKIELKIFNEKAFISHILKSL